MRARFVQLLDLPFGFVSPTMLEGELDKSIAKKPAGEKEVDEERTVRCMNCEADITKPSLAIEPHEHTFKNPAGHWFRVVCYGDAPGASNVGEPTTEATWFSGYAWSFAICLECKTHLGWWFNGPDTFVGLIASRLIR